MSETQALVRPSIRDFFTELERVDKELLPTRPSRLSFGAFSRWCEKREKRIAEIAKRFVELDSPESLSGSGLNVNAETIKEAKAQLIKATCIEEKKKKAVDKENKNIIRESFARMVGVQLANGRDCLMMYLVRVGSGGDLSLSIRYDIVVRDLKIFTNVPNKDPMLLVGRRGSFSDSWADVHDAKLHLHSEKDVEILFR